MRHFAAQLFAGESVQADESKINLANTHTSILRHDCTTPPSREKRRGRTFHRWLGAARDPAGGLPKGFD